MPGALVTGHKLDNLPVAPDQKVRRHTDTPNLLEIGMLRMIQRVGKETRDGIPRVLAGRQTDVMDDQQLDSRTRRSGILIGRRQAPHTAQPTLCAHFQSS
jgi:hypothetical protein